MCRSTSTCCDKVVAQDSVNHWVVGISLEDGRFWDEDHDGITNGLILSENTRAIMSTVVGLVIYTKN